MQENDFSRFTQAEIERILIACINELYQRDLILLTNDVSERAITHKLAEYLQQEIPDLNVDCEYNRNVGRGPGKPKSIILLESIASEQYNRALLEYSDETKTISTYPDIIVHRRGTNDFNLLVIEVKKSNSQDSYNLDYKKLEVFTENTEYNSYHFTYGVFLVFEIFSDQPSIPKLEWFREGRRSN